MAQVLFILGRQPQLSKAELRAVFPRAQVVVESAEFLVFDGLDIAQVDLRRLGGTVKVGEVFASAGKFNLQDPAKLLLERASGTTGKFTFGASCYGSRFGTLKTLLIGLKKALRNAGVSARFVNKNFANLSSAAVQLEGLTSKGVEILTATDGRFWFYAATTAVQPFDEYKTRDYEKVARDARIGMLPPKLAQIMLNLSQIKKGEVVYDPFCGTGTVLIEAALLGFTAMGSDIDEKMVAATQKNLAALKLVGEVFLHDAAKQKQVDCNVVVSEGYLGPPTKLIPEPPKRAKIFAELAELYGQFFSWVPARRVVLTLPVYCSDGQPQHFSSQVITPAIEKQGWVRQDNRRLLYVRPGQVVGRELTIWERA